MTVLPANDSERQDSLWVCPECGTACHERASGLQLLPGGGLGCMFGSDPDDTLDDDE